MVQLVVDWLEHSSADMLDSFYNKVDFSSNRMGAWSVIIITSISCHKLTHTTESCYRQRLTICVINYNGPAT